MRFLKLESGRALIIRSRFQADVEERVVFSGGIVWPHQEAEVMDITLKALELAVPARSKDGQAVLVQATVLLRIPRIPDAVLKVRRDVGSERAGDSSTLRQLFEAMFSETVKTATSKTEYQDLAEQRLRFRDTVFEFLDHDWVGYVFDNIFLREITPRDFQEVLLGDERFILDWVEVRQAGRLDKLAAEHGFSVLARRLSDGSVQHAPAGNTRLSPGEALAVAIASDRYGEVQSALGA